MKLTALILVLIAAGCNAQQPGYTYNLYSHPGQSSFSLSTPNLRQIFSTRLPGAQQPLAQATQPIPQGFPLVIQDPSSPYNGYPQGPQHQVYFGQNGQIIPQNAPGPGPAPGDLQSNPYGQLDLNALVQQALLGRGQAPVLFAQYPEQPDPSPSQGQPAAYNHAAFSAIHQQTIEAFRRQQLEQQRLQQQQHQPQQQVQTLQEVQPQRLTTKEDLAQQASQNRLLGVAFSPSSQVSKVAFESGKIKYNF